MARLIISADSHVFEPHDLWLERLPARLKDRAPRREERDGRYVMLVEGMRPRTIGAVGEQHETAPGGTDPDARLRDLAADGVSAEVIYPTIGLFVDLIPDPELQIACARAYNDWCADQFFARQDVFAPAALIPVRDVALAKAELERVATRGFRTAMLPTTPPGAPWSREVWDPLFDVAEAARMPLSFHVGTGENPVTERGPGGAIFNYVKVDLLAQEALVQFVAGGVLDRRPDLHVAIVESGAGWLGHVCERMDEAFEEHAQWVHPKLSLKPSELVRRQLHVTFGNDTAALLLRGITGVEPLLWASDYPHPEGTWPESRQVIEKNFAGVPTAETDAIVGANAARLYGFAQS